MQNAKITAKSFVPVWFLAGLGTSRGIPAGATFEQVQTALSEDFPMLGRILVAREEYIYCACDDGFIWTVTFDEVRVKERGLLRKYKTFLATTLSFFDAQLLLSPKYLSESPVFIATTVVTIFLYPTHDLRCHTTKNMILY